ncbi:MAG TPA: sigma-54 dependent transcriptional regulator [Methylomirabilota bacterium]|nr:sigma-54 dependent transcriptional regulator [Methylomirabilota bacterium]
MTILVVDDEANIRSSLTSALGREGYQADQAASLAEARGKLRESYDFVLLDVWFPDGSGLDLLAEIMAGNPDTVAIMMSGHATVDAAVKATRLGAFDFLEKPISLERLLILLRNASETAALKAENRRLTSPWSHGIVGRSRAIEDMLGMIQRAAKANVSVLIQGENGTGKELVARALHAAGARRDQPFVAVNCSAIPEELIESELFGHERGAFTGATQSRRGVFEEANHGTLFLDEIGDMSLRAQTKLLRALQEHEVTRVGGNRAIKVDARVISATNQDLAERIRAERFREDLYFRIAVVPIAVPPLRERVEDIPLLVEHFAAQMTKEAGGRARTFGAAAVELLQHYSFPGNVRELRNLVERLWIMTRGATIGPEQVHAVLPRPDGAAASGVRLSEAVREFERKEIEAALLGASGSMTKAASMLGLERSHLYKKMKKLGWKPEALRP